MHLEQNRISFCANFALQRNVKLYQGEYEQQVSEVRKENYYVDDCLICSNSETELVKLKKVLCDLLQSVGFCSTKGMSNSKMVLPSIPPNEYVKSIVNHSFQYLSTHRTLGLLLKVCTDSFKFEVHLPNHPVTIRGMLSCVPSLYDSLGFVSPILLPAKQLLQELCI